MARTSSGKAAGSARGRKKKTPEGDRAKREAIALGPEQSEWIRAFKELDDRLEACAKTKVRWADVKAWMAEEGFRQAYDELMEERLVRCDEVIYASVAKGSYSAAVAYRKDNGQRPQEDPPDREEQMQKDLEWLDDDGQEEDLDPT